MIPPDEPDGGALRVELLGSGGYHPTERRHTACLLLPELGLLLDAGTGAFRVHDRVAKGGLPSDRLDVVLTHAHLDHVVGLTFLFGLSREGRPVETVVHAERTTLEAVEQRLLDPQLFPIAPVTDFQPLSSILTLRNGARVTVIPLEHPGGSVGLRIDARGKSIAYITDTKTISPETIEAVRGVDLLLHEAYFEESKRELADLSGHCTAGDAARTARDADARRLVMVHVDPRADDADEARSLAEAQAIRPDAVYGTDGMVIEV